MTGSAPIPFTGTPAEAAANYQSHAWVSDGDETPVCMSCDSKMWHAAALYPCGIEPPRRPL